MELLIPLAAIGGVYFINNQSRSAAPTESFTTSSLPNTNIPDVNFPPNTPITSPQLQITSDLAVNNRYSGDGAYTDKYFSQYEIPKGDPSVYKSASGQPVSADYFTHNNMVPFTKGKDHRVSINSDTQLDNMMGAGSQYIKKKELSPQFAPQSAIGWNNGMPNVTDFIKSRMNESNKFSNMQPFEKEMVAPITGDASLGEAGYNRTMYNTRNLEKNVDELRTANNPKATGLTLFGFEAPAVAYNKSVADVEQQGRVEKRRPEKVFENGPERWFTGISEVKGELWAPKPNMPHQHREDTMRDYTGIAAGELEATYMPGEYMPTHKQQLGELQMLPANLSGRNIATESDYGSKSHILYDNNRTLDTDESDGYFGSGAGATMIGAVLAPLIDALRFTRKDNTVGNARPYQNARGEVPQSYVFDTSQPLAPTIKELTEVGKDHKQVNMPTYGGYGLVRPELLHTTRMETEQGLNYTGTATSRSGIRPYDAEYNQRLNDKRPIGNVEYMNIGGMATFNNKLNNVRLAEDVRENTREQVASFKAAIPSAGAMGYIHKPRFESREQGVRDSYRESILANNDLVIQRTVGSW